MFSLDQAQFIMAYVLPLIMLAIKVGIMWATWSLLMAATEFLRVLTKRLEK